MNTPGTFCNSWRIRNRSRTSQIAIEVSAILIGALVTVRADLPPIPHGVSVLNTQPGDKGLRTGILTNPDVDMISLSAAWNDIQPEEFSPPNWSDLEGTIGKIPDGKSILLRIPSMGGSATNGGNTPDWVFTDMGVPVDNKTAVPGVTYSWTDTDGTMWCIPVFWNPVYLAKKKALIAMAGAELSNITALKIVVVSYANAITEDWNVPNAESGDPSQVDLWLNKPRAKVNPGAGYTTNKMISAAIHEGDETFTDGLVQGTTLTSASATFTQADLGHQISGPGYSYGTQIVTWLSPTQATLNKPLTDGTGSIFRIKARRDGLIDVAMAAFPNQYICTSVGGNGPDLDTDCPIDEDAGTCLASAVDSAANAAYPGRYIVQRNNVSAIIPYATDEKVDKTAWVLLNEAVMDGIPTAGQALGPVSTNDGSYRMNDGNNCDHDDSTCIPDDQNLCYDTCALSFCTILERSAERIASYSANYYEVYPPDASNEKGAITYIHNLLTMSDPSFWTDRSLGMMTSGSARRFHHSPPTDCTDLR